MQDTRHGCLTWQGGCLGPGRAGVAERRWLERRTLLSDRTFSSTEGECILDTKHLGIVDDRFRYACDAAVVEVDARNHVGENARNNFEKNEKIKWAAQHVPVLMRLRAMITAASRHSVLHVHAFTATTATLSTFRSIATAGFRAGGSSERAKAPSSPVPRVRRQQAVCFAPTPLPILPGATSIQHH